MTLRAQILMGPGVTPAAAVVAAATTQSDPTALPTTPSEVGVTGAMVATSAVLAWTLGRLSARVDGTTDALIRALDALAHELREHRLLGRSGSGDPQDGAT